MTSKAVARLPKPDWTNCQIRGLYKTIAQGFALGITVASLGYFKWYLPKWTAIENYQKNYDPFAEFERMRNLGIFSCCPPDYVIEERKQKALAKQAKKQAKKK